MIERMLTFWLWFFLGIPTVCLAVALFGARVSAAKRPMFDSCALPVGLLAWLLPLLVLITSA
jgi:hypothetical protein